MSTAYYTHPDCLAHDMGRGHPECPERLAAIHAHLKAIGLLAHLIERRAPLAALPAIARAHDWAYVKALQRQLEPLAQSGEVLALDPDTSASPGTWQAILRAAGAAVAATDAVMAGEITNAFCAVRPPGHHATRDEAMGFCFVDNVAVAARHALDAHGLKRVAIVDFDVHHGNGTEDIVAGDERILMASFFQSPLYPGSGTRPLGANMLNVPVPPHTRGPQIRKLVDELWVPRLDEFKPEMLFISAGFDAHRDDGLAQLALVEDDYDWITRRIKAVAERHAKGRIVSCLEGGYALDALARSVAAHLRVLADL